MTLLETPSHLNPPQGDFPPAWEIATLFPPQGRWTPEDYLRLTDDTSRLVEFKDGWVEVLEMPKPEHQFILIFLTVSIREYLQKNKTGSVLVAPVRLRIDDREFREPDVIVKLKRAGEPKETRYWTRADLVVEIVSDGKEARERDTVVKRAAYADAAVPEYWIVDPMLQSVTILLLQNGAYVEAGTYRPGAQIASAVLAGFVLDVAAIFASAEEG